MGVGVTGGNALTNPSESGVLSPNGGEGEGDSPCVTERSGFSVWLGGVCWEWAGYSELAVDVYI